MKQVINLKNNEIIFSVNSKIYSSEAVYMAGYVFADRMHVSFDAPNKKEIIVHLKGKDKINEKELQKMKGEFINEILNFSLREKNFKKNKKILEYVVAGAINAALEREGLNKGNERNEENEEMTNIEKEIESLKRELEQIDTVDFEKDSLGIKKIFTEKELLKNKKKKQK